jgi:hypothetical protein
MQKRPKNHTFWFKLCMAFTVNADCRPESTASGAEGPLHIKSLCLLGALLLSLALTADAAPWKIYLLFGQSNMSGGATPGPDDVFNNARVKVLAYNNCSGRTYNEWYTATGALRLLFFQAASGSVKSSGTLAIP